MSSLVICCLLFFFNDTATTEIYTLSLHDALPIYKFWRKTAYDARVGLLIPSINKRVATELGVPRSEEHTSELQSPDHLVCRLLLEKKKKPRFAISSISAFRR